MAPNPETRTACVSTFCVVSGTLHIVLLSPVFDADERTATDLLVTLWAVGAMLSVVTQTTGSSSDQKAYNRRVSWSRVQTSSVFVNTVLSSRVAAINVPC